MGSRGSRAVAVLATAMAALGTGLCFYYVRAERAFYYWDYVRDQDLAREAAHAFARGPLAGLQNVPQTLSADYNALCAVPLVPIVAALGDQRPIYLCGLLLVYHLPLALLCGFCLKRILPEHGVVAVFAAASVAFFTPTYWYSLLRGYSDESGALLLAVAVLLHVTRPVGAWRLHRSLAIGAALGTSIVLRRHYAYGVVSFFLSLTLDSLAAALGAESASPKERGRSYAPAPR